VGELVPFLWIRVEKEGDLVVPLGVGYFQEPHLFVWLLEMVLDFVKAIGG
jgi:hypothetical protein